jgi:hypothetical protein
MRFEMEMQTFARPAISPFGFRHILTGFLTLQKADRTGPMARTPVRWAHRRFFLNSGPRLLESQRLALATKRIFWRWRGAKKASPRPTRKLRKAQRSQRACAGFSGIALEHARLDRENTDERRQDQAINRLHDAPMIARGSASAPSILVTKIATIGRNHDKIKKWFPSPLDRKSRSTYRAGMQTRAMELVAQTFFASHPADSERGSRRKIDQRRPPTLQSIRNWRQTLTISSVFLAAGSLLGCSSHFSTGDLDSEVEAESNADSGSMDSSSSDDSTALESTGDVSNDDGEEQSTDDLTSELSLPKFDLADDVSLPPIEDYPLYLLHVNGAKQLMHVSIVDASLKKICDLHPPAGSSDMPGGVPSLTFNRDDQLFASDGAALWQIALPSCEITKVGAYGNGISAVNGILPARDAGLFGISGKLNALIQIDPQTGQAQVIGELGQKWGAHGASWSDRDQTIYAINAADNKLYRVDPQSGKASEMATIEGVKFSSVGMDVHPGDGKICACTGNDTLYEIELDGHARAVGNAGWGGCADLGAPFGDPILPGYHQ